MSRSIAAVLALAVFAAPAPGLELRLQANGGVAADLPPSATTAWLWVDHRLSGEAPLITHGTEITPDADADGRVELEVPAGVSPLSVWVAVDLTTGSVATASPEGFERPAFSPPDAPELLVPLPSATRLQAPARIVRAVVSRPGVGAWQALAGDGTVLDADGEQDGVLTLDLAQLEPVGDSPAAPESFAAGDTLVLIDVDTLGLFQGVVSEPPFRERPAWEKRTSDTSGREFSPPAATISSEVPRDAASEKRNPTVPFRTATDASVDSAVRRKACADMDSRLTALAALSGPDERLPWCLRQGR